MSSRRRLAVVLAVICAAAVLHRGGLSTPRPSIVLISVDTLRADHVGAYGYPLATTPFLDTLARQGLVFKRVVVPLPATGPSHSSLLTSLHPLEHGVMVNAGRLPAEVETIAEVLKRNGYFTMAAVSVTNLNRRYGFDQGFDLFSDDWQGQGSQGDSHRRNAAGVTLSAYALMDAYLKRRASDPFFLFVHYFDLHAPDIVHDPSLPSAGARSVSTGPDEATLIQRYDSNLRSVDDHVRSLYEYLEARGLTKKLVICITGDHGEQLGEHGRKEGHADIYRETITVPLVLHGRGIPVGVDDALVSSMDVGVSLLERAGLRFSSVVSGRSVFGRDRDRDRQLLVLGYPSYTRSLALVSRDWIFVRNLDRFYRYLAVASPRGSESWGREAPRIPSEDGVSWFSVPPPGEFERLEPADLVLEVRLEAPGCRSTLSVLSEPMLDYVAERIEFNTAVRVLFPVVPPRDDVVLALSACSGTIRYTMKTQLPVETLRRRFGESAVLESRLWMSLLTTRKYADGDELYDIRSDPAMDRNVVDEASRQLIVRAARDLILGSWRDLSARRRTDDVHVPYGEDERRMLKSLGYVQ